MFLDSSKSNIYNLDRPTDHSNICMHVILLDRPTDPYNISLCTYDSPTDPSNILVYPFNRDLLVKEVILYTY